MTEFYEFHARYLGGEDISFQQFAGKVVLVVNTASKCGFTPQYKDLETLYHKYSESGLVILGFPCNQFLHQEPGDESAIRAVCQINYGVTFPILEKIDVNGVNAHPLFVWLKIKLPGAFGKDVKWNFTKFLVGRDGTPLKRFAPITSPAKIESHIRQALKI